MTEAVSRAVGAPAGDVHVVAECEPEHSFVGGESLANFCGLREAMTRGGVDAVSLVRIDEQGIVTSDDGRRFVVLALPDGLRVVDAVCPHDGWPARAGLACAAPATLVCPWHWYRFDLDTGASEPRPAPWYTPCTEDDDGRYADVGEPARVLSWSERLRAHARE